jgi:hypothetical protein
VEKGKLSEEHSQSGTDKDGTGVSSDGAGSTSVGWWWNGDGSVAGWWGVNWSNVGAAWADGGGGGHGDDGAGSVDWWSHGGGGGHSLNWGLAGGLNWSLSSSGGGLDWGLSGSWRSRGSAAWDGDCDTGASAEDLSGGKCLLDLGFAAGALDAAEDSSQEGGSRADASDISLGTSRGTNRRDGAGESAGWDLVELGGSEGSAGDDREDGRGLHFDRLSGLLI